jgi:hypothetical protein
MAQQELNGAQIPGPSVDQRGFRATEGVRTEQPRIQANTGDPTRHQARVLSGRDAAARPGSAFKQILADVLLLRLKVSINRFRGQQHAPGLLSAEPAIPISSQVREGAYWTRTRSPAR